MTGYCHARWIIGSVLVLWAALGIVAANPEIVVETPILHAGDLANFTINITNGGETRLDNVTVVDTLPMGMRFISDDRGGLVEGQMITWRLGSLACQQSAAIRITVQVAPSAKGFQVNEVVVRGTSPGDEVVEDRDRSSIRVMQRRENNLATLEVGDDLSEAIGSEAIGFGFQGVLPTAENKLQIFRDQISSSNSNRDKYNRGASRVGDREARAFGGGIANNRVKISIAQR